MPVISFYSLVAVTRTSYTVLNDSGKSGHLCLLPKNAFSFSPLSVMLAVGLSYMAFIMLRYLLSIPVLLRFYLKGMLI